MELELDQINDRRTAPRLELEIPVRYSDYGYQWEGVCTSVGVGGCFIQADDPFEPGKDLEVVLFHPDGDELTKDAVVRWGRQPTKRLPGGMGLAFDNRDRRSLELITDFIERLALEDVMLATRYRDAMRPLSITAVLYHARNAPENPVLSDAERTLLSWIDGSRDLRSIRQSVGSEAWDQICYTPFSLRGKGMVTTERTLAADSAAAGTGTKPAASAGVGVQERNAQAHKHYERAIDALESDEPHRALTEARLAIMLAPGDPEVSRLISELEE